MIPENKGTKRLLEWVSKKSISHLIPRKEPLVWDKANIADTLFNFIKAIRDLRSNGWYKCITFLTKSRFSFCTFSLIWMAQNPVERLENLKPFAFVSFHLVSIYIDLWPRNKLSMRAWKHNLGGSNYFIFVEIHNCFFSFIVSLMKLKLLFSKRRYFRINSFCWWQAFILVFKTKYIVPNISLPFKGSFQ